MKTHKVDCKKCLTKDSVLLTIDDVTVTGFSIITAPCDNPECAHQGDAGDYLVDYMKHVDGLK